MQSLKTIAPGKWYTELDESGNAIKAYYDESYRKILGYNTEKEYADAMKQWTSRIHPEDSERVEKYVADVLSKHPEGKDYDIEYRMMTKWGYRWFHDYGLCTRREDGSLKRCDGVMFDIQEIKDYEMHQRHDALKKEVLDYIVNHNDDDPIDLLSQFAEKIRTLLDCDQVIYRDLEETRIMVNSPAIEDTWSVPIEFCQQCQHFDAHHPMYAGGYTEMDNCQEGWQGIPVYHKCPIKSSLTRIVYCNGEVAGYFAIHYVQRYHQFTEFERITVEEFVRNLSIMLSRYESGRKLKELKLKEEQQHAEIINNNQRIMALEDNFESLYEVELETGRYTEYVKGDYYRQNVTERLTREGDFFLDIRDNIELVIYPEDRDGLNEILKRENIREALSKAERIDYYYRLFVEDKPVWFKLRIVYKDAERKDLIIGAFNASEELETKQIVEQREKIAEQATFTNFFLDTYVSAYYVNLDTLSCKTYKRTEQLEKDYPIITNYFDSVREYINKDVHPEDRAGLLESVSPDRMRETLRHQIEYSHIFRDISGGTEKIYRMQVIRGGEENHAAFGFIDITDEMAEQNRKLKEAEETRKLVDNLAEAYNMACIVNMKEDTLKILRIDEYIIGSKENFKSFSDARSFFLANVCHPADKDMMTIALDYDNIRSRLYGRRSFDVEYRAIYDGATVWFEMNVTSISGDDIAVGFVKKDLAIVKRRLEEKSFNEYLGLYVVDLDTRMVKPFRTTADDRIIEDGKAVPYDIKIKEFASGFEGEAEKFFDTISSIDYLKQEFTKDEKRSFAYRTPEGRWVDFTCYVIARHPDGAPSMCTFGYSDTDALASARNEMQKKIEENQERLKQDMELISGLANEYHALYYVNINERFFKVYSIDDKKFPEAKQMVKPGEDPAAMFRMFGASPLVHPDDRTLFFNLSSDTIRERLAHSKRFTMRFRRRFGDKFLWTEMEFIKYEDVDAPANVIAVGFAERDKEIRHEQEHKRQLEAAYKAAEIANKSKSDFLFNMSHDIRTPMNAIIGFTTMAKKNAGNTQLVLDYLNKIDVSGQQLLMLINQVLEMARIESGKIEFNEHPVNIKERFDAMITVLAEQAAVHGLDFNSSMEDVTHFNIFADDARMGQVTLNIAGNAIKYTPEGGRIDFKVKEIPSRKNGCATFEFTVADTGIGMSKDYLDKLYEPFSREKTSTVSQIQGTGLGLSIVKSLVDLAGGKIEVQSEPGKGTQFVVTMDFRINDNVAETEKAAQDLSAFNFHGKRALLVEDNELNREIAKFILEDKGVIIEDADDGDVAVERIRDIVAKGHPKYFDFILMDVQMPRMNGYQATAEIRAILDPLGLHVPIIAISANAFEEDKQKSREAGMDGHIAKPIDIEQLWTTLARFI